MNQHRKFLFNERFDRQLPGANTPLEIAREELRGEFELELATKCEVARKEGQEAALEQIENRTADTFDAIIEKLGEITTHLDSEMKTLQASAAELAFQAARKIGGELVARQPADLVEHCIADCLAMLPGSSTFTVSVAPELLAAMQQRLGTHAARAGLNGRIALRGDDSLKAGDCAINWDQGAIRFDRDKITEEIETAIARFLAPRTSPATKPAAARATNNSDTGQGIGRETI